MIAGEHEDHYDQDFCIYNGAIVFEPGRSIPIFCYPQEVFPPTDFHKATLVDARIIVIGCLGYPKSRRAGRTPVYDLDVKAMRISELQPGATRQDG